MVAGNLGENITLYVNFDYVWSHPANLPNANTYALAAAGRYQWNKDLGIAMRFEVVVVDPSNAQSEDEYSFTTTVDYALTDGLTARAEVRFDWGVGDKYRRAGDPYSFTGGADSQTLLLVELIYAF